MSFSKLIDLSGFAGIVGGSLIIVLTLIFYIGHLILPDPSRYIDVWGLPLLLIAYILILMALVGVYTSGASKVGTLGFIGFLMIFIGQIFIIGLIHFGYFAILDKVNQASTILSINHPSLYKESMIAIVLLTILGYILFGVALLRSSIFPRPGVLFLIIGAVLFTIPVILGMAFIILGNSLRLRSKEVQTSHLV
jgi:hypothetical protein